MNALKTTRPIGVRFNSTISKHIRPQPRIFQMLRTPVAKSLFLTFIFGSFMVDLMQHRKEFELLTQTHESKMDILNGIIDKLRHGDPVDVAGELKIANSLTKHKYNTVLDIELDEQLESFLKLSEEDAQKHVEGSIDQVDNKSFL